ncbi:MAG: hypothetical protein GY948_17085 [Alphaproteobacteria bacterium]|nr:hypothetical protein [Alphaproteobacteria bacterium]
MSIRMLSLSIPAAFLALGVVALSTSSSFATDNARDDYASTANRSVNFHATGFTVGHKKKHRRVRSSDRYSGFGFRGDGFRTSDKYN